MEVTEGRPIWTHRLTAKCLARPVVVERRIFVPLSDGHVDEIEDRETPEGRRYAVFRGFYPLGQRLRGGAHQPGTNLLYFAAESQCVYVLDCAERRCDRILYSRHQPGTLRREPVVLSWHKRGGQGQAKGYLILSLTRGLNMTQLQLYALPLTGAHAA